MFDFLSRQNDAFLLTGTRHWRLSRLALCKETLKGAVADYIVDELVINQVAHKHPDEVSRRAYAYYRMLYQRIQDGTKNDRQTAR